MELTTNQLPATLEASAVAPAAPATPVLREQVQVRAATPFYIPSLDGIRALAVSIVFFAHAGYDHIIPGGLGVTIFFFLSGYLITTLLRREQEKKGKISLKKFYLRRVLRIWPPMYLALAFAFILCISGVVAVNRVEPIPLLFQALHLTNIYIFVGDGHIMPGMGVLWSLCVEEHFYLFFPLMFILLSKVTTRTKIAVILGALCIAVLGWRMVLFHRLGGDPFRIFSGTDTRVDSILFGCIMALWKNPILDGARMKSLALKLALLAAGFALLLFTLLYRDEAFRSTWRYTLQGVALFPIFFLAVSEARWHIFRWLELAPMRGIGKISYTLYLVHFPIIYAAYETFPESRMIAVTIAAIASLIVATLVYYALEKPMAQFRHLLS